MQIDAVYKIENFKLRPSNTDYNNLGSLYEIEVIPETVVNEIHPVPDGICKIPDNFTLLSDVSNESPGKVIGIIHFTNEHYSLIYMIKKIKINN